MRLPDAEIWSRLSPLIDELLELEHPLRAARLLELCTLHPELAAPLRDLLASDAADERGDFMAGQVFFPANNSPAAGQKIGAYTLERELGVGGMGSVWLGRRSDGRFEGAAAVKFPHLSAAPGGAERFAREARLLGRLSHPNIASLLDAGVTEKNQPYLVIELVNGQPIDQWCDEHSATVEQRVRLFLEVLGAVEHAHIKFVLHRDLKPGNILVTAEGRVKLLDFGIAKLLETDVPAEQATLAFFTVDYAAPEQVQGTELSTTTDVYALGVLLFQLLAGRHPTALPMQSRLERMRAVVETEATALSTAAAQPAVGARQGSAARAPHALRRLRGDLENIVAKALRKRPAERYPTAAAMAEDLRRHLDGQPVSAGPDTLSYRVTKFVTRHRLSVGAASATLLALLAGVAATSWQALEARRERDEARYQTARAQSRSTLFGLMLGAMGNADRPLTQRQILEGSTRLVDSTYGREPGIAAELLLPIAGQYETLGDTVQDLALMRRAADYAKASGDANLVATIACNSVSTDIDRGRLDLAQGELTLGLQALGNSPHPRQTVAIDCANAGSVLARHQGNPQLALDRLNSAISLAERAGEVDAGGQAGMLGDKAILLQDLGDLPGALLAYQRVAVLEQAAGRTLAQLASERNAATVMMDMGEYAAARQSIDGVLSHWPHATATDPVPAYLRLSLGMILLKFEDFDGANRELTAARDTARAMGEPRFEVLGALFLGQVALATGRLGDAEKLLQEVRSAPVHLSNHYLANTLDAMQARLLLAQGDGVEAARRISQELARIDAVASSDERPRAATLRSGARIALAVGDAALAEKRARAAVASASRLTRDAAQSADVGEALLLLAQAQQAAGQRQSAVASARLAAVSLTAGLSASHPLTRQAMALSGS
jgi:serine/threonine protein kinase